MLCTVCSDEASGFHSGGQPTCPACRVFFRRQAVRRNVPICEFGGNCEITIENRGNCRYCRYQKCLRIGMDPSRLSFNQPNVNENNAAHPNREIVRRIRPVEHPGNRIPLARGIKSAVRNISMPFTREEAFFIELIRDHRRDALLAVPGLKLTLDSWIDSHRNGGGYIPQLMFNVIKDKFSDSWRNFINKLEYFQE